MQNLGASIFDHPAVLLLIVFVALVRWLISKAKSQTQDRTTPMAPPPSQPITRGGQTQTEEERIRKFLEALGQPPGTTPPKVAPRPRPTMPKIFPTLPPLKSAPPPLPTEPIARVAPPQLPVPGASWQPAVTAEPRFEVRDVGGLTPGESQRPARVRVDPRLKLGSRQDLRSAIILREIFGPPRSLQSFDLTSGA